ncbi:class D sortase [Halobacillus halophilus]|uniref:class D sortase n=1 Tax=Halobacillus halophilus TaxID=1570 RepID=UPI001CD6C1BA|nr:class D sortase [Halobacillus halophilus]MCA1011998.1 class D sortase [Halobacillus halophilus]
MLKSKKLITYSFLLLSMILLIGGAWFTTTSVYTFVKGYFLYQTGVSTAESLNEEKVNSDSNVPSDYSGKVGMKESERLYPDQPDQGDLIGELYIPKLEAAIPIYHGTDEDELEKGVGHFAGSVLPGEADNSILSGHRDTVFRELGEIGMNDLLIVTTAAGEFTYKVRKVRIVDEDDRTVIVPKPKATLTLTTCYPFHFSGPAPQRFILVADLRGEKLTKKE